MAYEMPDSLKYADEPPKAYCPESSCRTAGLSPPVEEKINQLWKGSPLEGKARLLIDECQRSTQVDACVMVIAGQTRFETEFGTSGTGREHFKNLTGIRDKVGDHYVWRKYEKYDDSIRDTVKVFIDGNYQDYYTLYGFDKGVCLHLARWGTNHCEDIKQVVKSLK